MIKLLAIVSATKMVKSPLQSADYKDNFNIPYGTLTPSERQIINHHIDATIKILEALLWSQHLEKVPKYASGHHERMDGKGYPRVLKPGQMSIQARVMGIADIFEALTANDRPCKVGKTLSASLHVLGKFKLNGHIDPDLFDVFEREKVYLKYAEQFLDPTQVDTVDEGTITGYKAESEVTKIVTMGACRHLFLASGYSLWLGAEEWCGGYASNDE